AAAGLFQFDAVVEIIAGQCEDECAGQRSVNGPGRRLAGLERLAAKTGEAHGVTPRGYAGKATNEGRTRFRETILMAAREMSRPRHWPRRESPERIKTKKTSLPERHSPAGLDRKSVV